MKKLSIMDISVSAIALTILSIWIVFEKVFKFFSKCRMKKITEIEKLDDAIVFKNGHRHLFTLEKDGKYAINISSSGVIAFLYFGCSLENDYHVFRISHKILRRLKEILTPSNFMYEQGLYRL